MGRWCHQAERLEERAAGEVLDSAQVVAATCVGAGDTRLAARAFRLAVLDEATQARRAPRKL